MRSSGGRIIFKCIMKKIHVVLVDREVNRSGGGRASLGGRESLLCWGHLLDVGRAECWRNSLAKILYMLSLAFLSYLYAQYGKQRAVLGINMLLKLDLDSGLGWGSVL